MEDVMKKWFIIIGVVVSLFSASTTLAQINLNNISVNIGRVRNDLSSSQDILYSVYPEIQLSGDFFIPSIRWTVYWGYWTDGKDKEDQVEYWRNIHIVGTRFTLLPKKLWDTWDLPIGIFIGFRHHFLSAKGFAFMTESFNGSLELPHDLYATTFDVGLIAEVQVLGPFGIKGELQKDFLFGENEYGYMDNYHLTYKAGIFYTF